MMMAAASRLRRDRRGSAAIEFAVIGPVFILAVLAIVETGRGFMTLHDLDASLSRVRRLVYLNPTISSAELQRRVCVEAATIACRDLSVTVSPVVEDGRQWIELTLSVPFNSPMSALVGAPNTISSTHRFLL